MRNPINGEINYIRVMMKIVMNLTNLNWGICPVSAKVTMMTGIWNQRYKKETIRSLPISPMKISDLYGLDQLFMLVILYYIF